MDAGSLLLGLALLVIVAAFVLRPFMERRTQRGPAPLAAQGDHTGRPSSAMSAREELLRQRDAIYAAIRELDFDFHLGKVSEDDYRPQRERLALQGVAVLKQLDAFSSNGAMPAEDEIEAEIVRRRKRDKARKARPLSDAEIEAQIRALRRKDVALPPMSFCPRCGATASPEDRFCRNCGTALGSQGASISATGV